MMHQTFGEMDGMIAPIQIQNCWFDCCTNWMKSCVMRFDSISTCLSVEKQMYHNFLSRIKRVSLTKWVAGFCEFFIDPVFGVTFVALTQENAEIEHIS